MSEKAIFDSARIVSFFMRLRQELGGTPNFEQFCERGHENPHFPAELRPMLLDLWREIIIPEMAFIIAHFAEELTPDKFYNDILEYATFYAPRFKETVTPEEILKTTLSDLPHIYSTMINSSQRKDLIEEITKRLQVLQKEEKT